MMVIIIDNKDPGIYYNATQQDERGEAALVEVEVEQVKGEKHPYKGNWDNADDGQGLQQRLEQDGTGKINNHNDQQDQQILLFILGIPS